MTYPLDLGFNKLIRQQIRVCLFSVYPQHYSAPGVALNSLFWDFQNFMTQIRNNLGLKYQNFIPSDCKDIGIIKLEFVSKTQIQDVN